MKLSKSTTTFPCLVLSAFIFFSCSKSNSSSSAPAPTTDDAASAAASSIELGSGGYADQAGIVTAVSGYAGYGSNNGGNGHEQLMGGILTCGVPYDTTFSWSYTGPNVTASSTHQLQVVLDCANTTLDFTGNFQGSYDGPDVSGSRTGTRDWVLSGIGSDTLYTLNGTFACNGVWTMKVYDKNTFTNTVNITGTNVTVSKTTHRITGGSGTIAITSVVSNGKSYSFTGTIVFNGDHTATLTINGKTYLILI